MRSSVVDANRVPGKRGAQYQPSFQTQESPPHHSGPSQPLPHLSSPQSSQEDETFSPVEGWLPLLFLTIAVYSVVYSVVAANWVDHSIVLLISPIAGLLLGMGVAKMPRMPQSILHIAACLFGHWLSIWLTSFVAFHTSWLLLLSSLRAVITGGLVTAMVANGQEMVFFFYLCFLCFFLGYFGSWLIYRAHLPWLVAFVYCSILLVNLDYVKQDMLYLIIVLLGALLLLIARTRLTTQMLQWKREGLHTDSAWVSSMTRRGMQGAMVLTLLIIVSSPLLPIMDQSASGKVFWDQLDNAWTNIINGHVPLQNPGTIFQPYQPPANFFGDSLTISGSVHLPTGEVLDYTSSAGPGYLEGFTYNQFDGHTWSTSLNANDSSAFDASASLHPDVQRDDYVNVNTSVTIVQPPENIKHYIFGPAQPTSFDVSTIVYSDGMAGIWTKDSPLTSGEHYQVTSITPPNTAFSDPQYFASVPVPADNADYWSQDGNYDILKTYYLQIPPDLSNNVIQTAKTWTRGATNAYTALKMLEAHLSNQDEFTYSIDNTPIPSNVDVVDWLLQTRKGYCTYYASAMSTMARLLGIPTRVVSGFSHGHFDARRKVWVVQGDDAHSWVQAYLPNYGWISFDPTPGFAPAAVKQPQPTAQPTVKPTPVKPVPTVTPPGRRPAPTPTQHQPIASHDGSTSLFHVNPSLLAELSVVVLLLSLLFFVFALGRYWWRTLYVNSSFISGMYWRVCHLARLIGLGPRTWQTPYEYSRMLSRQVPQNASLLRHLTDLFVRDRWAAPYQAPHEREIHDATQLWPSLWRMLGQLAFKRIKK